QPEPEERPEISIVPEPGQNGEYRENTTITAKCSYTRPVLSLILYFGDDNIKNVSSEDPGKFLENVHRVNTYFTHKLNWTDNGKYLRCEANYSTNDKPISTKKQIHVVFPPKPREELIKKSGLVIGMNETVNIKINANPKPTIKWNIGSEEITEGNTDAKKRLTISQTKQVGNDMWETSLTIPKFTSTDLKRSYTFRAHNYLGEQQYRIELKNGTQENSCASISEECLTCLCEARTECDFNYSCNDDYCGPFQISYFFWIDGGEIKSKITPLKGEKDWQTCGRDPFCAAQVVRNYTKRYCKDCNEDGIVDCTDFALMHQNGGPSCGIEPTSYFAGFKQRLDICLEEIKP
ncbi:hypothetical protein L9F63_014424, partial [Diploptera punctata]